MTKVVVICGAGSTFSEAAHSAVATKPPLDRGFFKICKRLRLPEYDAVADYLKEFYSIDVSDGREDSIERILSVLYADLKHPAGPNVVQVGEAFRAFLSLVNYRIATTTSKISPKKGGNLYRLIRGEIVRGIAPKDISVITFNYDLHVERVLHELDEVASLKRYGQIFTFPHCYRLKKYRESTAPKTADVFSKRAVFDGIEVLKLHGSLNWVSQHESANPPPASLIKQDVELWVTRRRKVATNMKISNKFTFPIIVPPVVNKSSILHQALAPIWKAAYRALSAAERVIVFGYSCPHADQESANLISRALKRNKELKDLTVIDPVTGPFDRFAELTAAQVMHYFRSAKSYLSGRES